MRKKLVGAVLIVGLSACLGCTTVQKGTAAGGAIGSSVGALWGHTTPVGGGQGALIGLGVGAIPGALAAEHYYGDKETGDSEIDEAKLSQMEAVLRQKQAEVADLQGALQREQKQQEALLEAHGEMTKELERLKELKGKFGENVTVTGDENSVTLSILSEVLFDSGKADLTEDGKRALAQAADAIRAEFPNAEIEVRGHTDNVPIRYSPYKDNWDLSAKRALAVLRYLLEKEAFNAERMRFAGFGETRPVASNDTPEGRRQNRRAEIVIFPKSVQVADTAPKFK